MLSSSGLVCQDGLVRCVGLVWFVRFGWSGRVCQVRSSLQALVAWVLLVCMVELRWIGRFLVKMVGLG